MAEFFDEAAKKPLLTYVPHWIHPNYLSVLRALIAFPVVLSKDIPALSISLLILSSIFDLLDGPLARVRSQKSNLGAWLDSTADKVFVLLVLYLACMDQVYRPIIVAITVLEVSLVGVRIIKEWRNVKTDSNQFGAMKTWSQSIALAFVLSQNALLLKGSLVAFVIAIGAACLSFVFHVRDFSRRHPV